MLKRLILKNYALVDEIEIGFGPGLTVLTGETGAGKSVIIGGLLLALGGRADKDFIRHGAKAASAEAHFDMNDFRLGAKLQERLALEGRDLILAREILASGSSRAYLSGRPDNLQHLRDAASFLADFHTQQGQKRLLDSDCHLELLDGFAGLTPKVAELERLFDKYTSAAQSLNQAEQNAAAVREKLELANFQIDELTRADLHPDEEAGLEIEKRRLEAVQLLAETAQTVVTAISESDQAILPVLGALDRQLRKAADLDPALKENSSLLAEGIINLDELTRNLQSYLSRLEDNPARLEYINSRLAEIYRLKRKYATDEAGLSALLADLKEQSQGAGDYDALLAELRKRRQAAHEGYLQLATEVSETRIKAAETLQKKITAPLADLAMPGSKFKVQFLIEIDEDGFPRRGEKVKGYPQGLEKAEFLISPNPNEPLRPVAKIASGGELSRLMLALLGLIAGKYQLPTIIFDEIDTGIGGRTAICLAEKLKELSRKHQVIVISHLPAVAEKADHHLAVSKTTKDGRSIISVREVTGRQIKGELARMAGKPE